MRADLCPAYSFGAVVLAFAVAAISAAEPADPGWPRVFKKDNKRLTVHQPQVDRWHDYTQLQFRCAIALKGITKDEKFGVVEVEAQTVTDHEARTVAIVSAKRTLRFANVSESELARLRAAVDELYPPNQITSLALERVLAYLDPKQQTVQRGVEVNLAPPRIFGTSRPAILVIFMGEPQ